MNTLFIDTHSEEITIAIRKNDLTYELKRNSDHSHSIIATNTLKEILSLSSMEFNDIDQIVVVNGPGSFTGVRIGVTIAKTIAYSLNIKIKVISSLEAYGVSCNEDFDLITVNDSKGVFSAEYLNGKFSNFEYRKNNEFQKYVQDNNLKIASSHVLDLIKILDYLETADYINPHKVNPIYIKEIDVLK